MDLAVFIENMEAAGMDPAAILSAVKAYVATGQDALERRRQSDRKRQAKLRAKQDDSVTSRESRDSHVSHSDNPSPLVPPLSPAPLSPPIIPPTHAVLSLGARELETKLREAAGWQNEPAPNLFVTGPIEALLERGAILETDVLPVVKAHAPRVRRPASWRYFVPIITDAVEARINAGTGPPIDSQVVPFTATPRASHGQTQNRSESLSGRQFLNIATQRLAETVARTGTGGGGDVGGDFEGPS